MEETEKRDRHRYRISFYGRVQGVGFRYRAYHAATSLGLTGWVKNQWDESVEMEVEGETETIRHMVRQVLDSSYIAITETKWEEIPLKEGHSFYIR